MPIERERAMSSLLITLLFWLGGVVHARRRLPGHLLVNHEFQEGEDNVERGRPFRALTAQDHLVKSLPGLPPDAINFKHYAGLVPTNKDHHLFYWLVESRKDPKTDPIIIWLNGGPGCTSMEGMLLENGPFRIQPDGTVKIDEDSWNREANILFIDQPVGTGLSFSSTVLRTQEEINAEFYEFLQNFLGLHSGFVTTDTGTRRSREIYLFGESHAGRWIPSFAVDILSRNAKLKPGSIFVDIKGMGLGSAWVHPYVQYDYSDYGHASGLISEGQRLHLKEQYRECQVQLDKGDYTGKQCLRHMDMLLRAVEGRQTNRLNVYDIRSYVESSSDYPAEKKRPMRSYLDRKDVRQALHVADLHSKFEDCSNPVYEALTQWDGVSTLANVSYLLNQGMRTLFFNGQFDLMCNHIATEQLLYRLNWTGREAYLDSPKTVWASASNPSPYGYIKSSGDLTYLVLRNAGHMAPMDQPQASREMLKYFISRKPYVDKGSVDLFIQDSSAEGDAVVCPVSTDGTGEKNVYYMPGIMASTAMAGAGMLLGIAIAKRRMAPRGLYARAPTADLPTVRHGLAIATKLSAEAADKTDADYV